jgi:hypothetical protein
MKKVSLFALAGALALAGCIKSEYNMPQGMLKSVDKEITLFQDQITVPVGSIGPLTLSLVLDKIPLFRGFIQADEEGFLLAESVTEMYGTNVFETMAKTPEWTQPYTWNCGYCYGSPAGIALSLGYVGFSCPRQTVTITAKNPLDADGIALKGKLTVSRSGDDPWTYEKSLEGELLTSAGTSEGMTVLADVEVPGTGCISSFNIEDLAMDLPGNPGQHILNSDQQRFVFTGRHRSHLAVGSAFTMSPEIPLQNLSVPLGKYRLKKCVARLELVNTLPLNVTINSVKVLTPGESETSAPEEDTNIVISGPIHLAAGSLEAPVVSPVELQVEALEGTIPDLNGFKLSITVQGDDRFASTLLSAKQGVYIKSSSATLVGGITLDLNE